jgi:hypothetical protein
MRQLTNLDEAFHELNRLLHTAIAADKVEVFDTYPSDSSASLDAWLRGKPEMSRQLIEEYMGEWRRQRVESGATITRIHAVDRVPESSKRSYLAHEIYVVYPFLQAGIEKIFLAPRVERIQKNPWRLLAYNARKPHCRFSVALFGRRISRAGSVDHRAKNS